MFAKAATWGILFVFCSATVQVYAQPKQDTLKGLNKSKTFRKFLGMITRDQVDESPEFVTRSEDPYLPYSGKIIRHIRIKSLGFEQNVLDTSNHVESFIARAAAALHTNTREFVVRDNLFIREGQPLNPLRAADNERTLRNLTFILDARILVRPITGNADSVDLLVITRDVFSLGGSLEPALPARIKVLAQDINAGGMGQGVLMAGLYDIKRNPNIGFEAAYQKVNIAGSFVDAAAGYTVINTGTSLGNENEKAYFFRLNRPLYQPFAKWAGGFEVSRNISRNVFGRPDSVFVNYQYNLLDGWAGYAFGNASQPTNLQENRNRRFVAIRGFRQEFTNPPIGNLNGIDRYTYRSRSSVLAQITWFKLNYYKTQFVVGFGRTEDIPYGYRMVITGGMEEELGRRRPYTGAEVNFNKVRKTGTIIGYTAKLATYWNAGGGEDGLVSVAFKRYSKISIVRQLKIRHQTEVGYGWLLNQQLKKGIDIRDVNGIIGFKPDSLVGTQRVLAGEEVVIFTPSKFLGFRLAPLARIDLGLINRNSPLVRSANLYAGFSAGIRARNENLIFNTVEARIFYFPKTVEKVPHIAFSLTTNFVIRYPTNLISKPATVFN